MFHRPLHITDFLIHNYARLMHNLVKPALSYLCNTHHPKVSLYPAIHREVCPMSGRLCDVWLFRATRDKLLAVFVPYNNYYTFCYAYAISSDAYFQDKHLTLTGEYFILGNGYVFVPEVIA